MRLRFCYNRGKKLNETNVRQAAQFDDFTLVPSVGTSVIVCSC
jgi:hypothetical protein